MSINDSDQQSSLHEEVAPSQGSSSHYRSTFEVLSRQIKNPHRVQFYLDYGFSQSGPWLQVGVNGTEYGIGYEPGRVYPQVSKETTLSSLRSVASHLAPHSEV